MIGEVGSVMPAAARLACRPRRRAGGPITVEKERERRAEVGLHYDYDTLRLDGKDPSETARNVTEIRNPTTANSKFRICKEIRST
jgi:hypothetical protein